MYQTRQKFEKQFCKNVDAIVLKNASHPITPSSRKMYLFTKFVPAQITLTSNICQAPIKHIIFCGLECNSISGFMLFL